MNASAEVDSASLGIRLGFAPGQVVQEFGYDEDVDMDLRDDLEAVCGEELADEDYNNITDGALVWWRHEDGDSQDLTDLITDTLVTMEDGGLVWVLIPKAGREGHVEMGVVEEAASTAGMNTTNTVDPGGNWLGFRLTSRGRGR